MSAPRAYTVEEHYTPAETARLLGIGRSTLYRILAAGERTQGRDGIFPVRRIGGSTRIPATSINRYLAGCPAGLGAAVCEVSDG